MFELSPMSWGEWSDCDGEWHVNVKGGYQSVITALAQDLINPCSTATSRPEIRLNEPVSRIVWTDVCSDELLVRYLSSCDTVTRDQVRGPVLAKVTTAAEKTYSATHVIVTSSLGFLKENVDVFFAPRLPPKVELAIKSLGFGVIDKIFVTFPERFWEEDCRGIHMVWTDSPSPDSSVSLQPMILQTTDMNLGQARCLASRAPPH
jgi:monoamine oxidase